MSSGSDFATKDDVKNAIKDLEERMEERMETLENATKSLANAMRDLETHIKGMTYGRFEQKECSICLLPLYMGERCILPLCSHIFHHKCASAWVRRGPHCPICRKHWTTR